MAGGLLLCLLLSAVPSRLCAQGMGQFDVDVFGFQSLSEWEPMDTNSIADFLLWKFWLMDARYDDKLMATSYERLTQFFDQHFSPTDQRPECGRLDSQPL